MANSAFTKYTINTDFSSGDVVTGSFVDTAGGAFGGGVITINYLRVGNLYFGFNFPGIALMGQNGGSSVYTDTLNRIATKLGITIGTSYTTPQTSGTQCTAVFYDSGSGFWSFATNNNSQVQILAILAT